MKGKATLKNFQMIRPEHECSQEDVLKWIARAHTVAETRRLALDSESANSFEIKILEQLMRIGQGGDKVQKRGVHLGDVHHERWEEMDVYQLEKGQEGACLKVRTLYFERVISKIFERLYPEGCALPEHIIHVTCTGYTYPNPAQKLVSLRGGGETTFVTNAYHMGCFASMPAIRMSLGSLPTDIVHTELCSMHMNPLFHETEQLVAQSLFADGFIKYTVVPFGKEEGLHVIAQHEEIIPDTADEMTWRCEGWGHRMTLSKEVPFLIARRVRPFIERLAQKAECSTEELLQEAFFAIHPGGPKILKQSKKTLSLADEQLTHSYDVMQNYGNMSSATLPHIWDKMLRDPNVPKGSRIVSLGYGPGLTISGGLFQK